MGVCVGGGAHICEGVGVCVCELCMYGGVCICGRVWVGICGGV